MTGLSSTPEEATVLSTATPMDGTQQTTGSSMASSSARGVAFYVQCAVLVIGIVAMAANALVLYAMVASKQHKKYVLLFNQNLFDLVACFFLAAKYAATLSNIDLNGIHGYWLCITILSEGISWGPFMGSLINLAAITIERYLKIVHAIWSRKRLRKWMIYSAMGFAWISGITIAAAVTLTNAKVVKGVCYSALFSKSQSTRLAYGLWYFLSFYVIILFIFIFCYTRILIVVRRQAQVMATYATHGSNNAQTGPNQLQSSVIKTMILVSALFAITWTPAFVNYLIFHINSKLAMTRNGFYATMFMGYIYTCANPFIYATKFDPVRRILIQLIPCKKATQPIENIGLT